MYKQQNVCENYDNYSTMYTDGRKKLHILGKGFNS